MKIPIGDVIVQIAAHDHVNIEVAGMNVCRTRDYNEHSSPAKFATFPRKSVSEISVCHSTRRVLESKNQHRTWTFLTCQHNSNSRLNGSTAL